MRFIFGRRRPCRDADHVGRKECVLVVACDAVTEFVYSGFSSLMALDPDGARPFDKSRKGLTVGEAAATSADERRAGPPREPARGRRSRGVGHELRRESHDGAVAGRRRLGVCHGSGPQEGWRETASRRLDTAHGTGTVYNDSMEIKAFAGYSPGLRSRRRTRSREASGTQWARLDSSK